MTSMFRQRRPEMLPRENQPVSFRLLAMRYGLLAAYFALLGLFVLLCWVLVNATLYTAQIVKVDRVDTYCFLTKRSKRSSRIAVPPTLDCDGLRQTMQQENLSSRYVLSKDVFMAFTYMSPADGKTHNGLLRRRNNDSGLPARRGDQITIHASRLFAETFTDWDSPSF